MLPRLRRSLPRPIPAPQERLRRRVARLHPKHRMVAPLHERHCGIGIPIDRPRPNARLSPGAEVCPILPVLAPLEADDVRDQLVVEARLRESSGGAHVVVEHVPQVLDGGGDDAGAACGADDVVEGGVGEVLDYGGGDGGHGALVRPDVVGGRGLETELGGSAGDGEIFRDVSLGRRGTGGEGLRTVHLVVHNYAGFGHHEFGAED